MVVNMKEKTLRGKLRIGIFLVFIFLTQVYSGIKISPVQVLVVSPTRSAAIKVHNPSETEEREMWVEVKYGYQTVDEKGGPHVVLLPADSGGERSAAQWLRPYPQRFVLQPSGVQIVRVVAAPPSDLPDGEYWARVVISSKPTAPLRFKQKNQPTGVRSGFIMIEKADIPFHYRKGKLTTGLVIRNVTTTPGKDSMRVAVDLERTGNTSYWGTLTCRLKDHAGKIVSVFKKNLVVYKNETYLCFLKTVNVTSGEYTFEVNFNNTEGGETIRQYGAESESVNYSKSITLQ